MQTVLHRTMPTKTLFPIVVVVGVVGGVVVVGCSTRKLCLSCCSVHMPLHSFSKCKHKCEVCH